jgi:hypothetical protein
MRSPGSGPPSEAVNGGHDSSRQGKSRHGRRQSGAAAKRPDLAEAARQAVVSFLHDASAATAERESAKMPGITAVSASADPLGAAGGLLGAPDDRRPLSAAAIGPPVGPESAAVHAAAVGVATLERIEAAAAKVEQDIAAALQAHAELQAGAGRAAEDAVRAAQDAWVAAGSAVEADKRARVTLGLIARYVTITMALLFVAIVILLVTATTVH